MDSDKNGKISKRECMKFMEAEFDWLDTGKKGEIDPKEPLHLIVSRGGVRTSDGQVTVFARGSRLWR